MNTDPACLTPGPAYHHVEQAVHVELHATRDGKAWEVCDLVAVDDGEPLIAAFPGPHRDTCGCWAGDHDNLACAKWAARLAPIALPTAEELLLLLANKLGYTLTKRDTP